MRAPRLKSEAHLREALNAHWAFRFRGTVCRFPSLQATLPGDGIHETSEREIVIILLGQRHMHHPLIQHVISKPRLRDTLCPSYARIRPTPLMTSRNSS